MAEVSPYGSGGVREDDPRVVRTRKDVLPVVLRVLVEDEREVTHANVARLAGYSKATLYRHWPTREHLIREALVQLREVGHHTPTGDLRADLVEELAVYRTGLEHHQLDRALVVLVNLIATSMPELTAVRDRLVADGEAVVRHLLSPHLSGAELDAATLMLVGGVLQCVLLHGRPPADDVVEASVDLVLDRFGLDRASPPPPEGAKP